MLVLAGVTGHVGGAAARALLTHGENIRVIVRDAHKGTAWSARGADVAVGSLADSEFLAMALDGATGFFALLPADYASVDL